MTEQVLPRIAVLLAAHNRRPLTVRAIEALKGAEAFFDLTVVLLDDASKDGTADAVRETWPGAIVLQGDGNCFWNGGMHAAWTHALTLGMDGYLWLNDDVELDNDAIARLAEEWARQGPATRPFVLVGATRDHAGQLSYSGQVRKHNPLRLWFDRLPLADALQKADTFNGNIVLISKATVDRIGINDPVFLHTLGDIDYGMRASRAGIPIWVLPGTLGICNNNPPVHFNEGSIGARWRKITSHRGIPLRNWWTITRRYSGVWMPIHFLLPYRKIFMR
jgi:GT2 family glycosyltransferase